MQYRTVGDTGVQVSLLGVGTMRFRGRENAVEMCRLAIKKGLTYFDIGAAYSYQSDKENAESWVGAGLKGQKRENLVLSAKAQPRPGDAQVERCLGISTRDDMWACIEQSLRRVGVDYFDFYQFWDMSAPDHFDAACVGQDSPLQALREARDQGIVRHLGFTSHSGPANIIEWMKRAPEFRFITVYYNFVNRYVEEAIRYAAEKQVGVATMGSLYGGLLTGHSDVFGSDLPELEGKSVHEIAFRYLFSNPAITTCLSGMNEPEHLEENAACASDASVLTPGQCERFVRACQDFAEGEELCSGCRYCVNSCPFEMPIYKLMDVYQLHQIFRLPAGEEELEKLKQKNLDLGQCIACGSCSDACPQSLPIAKRMESLAHLLEPQET
ncbi:aldo/keto reductase [bacterium]|nr:aldo/keto reductase [bacterium]